MTMPGFAAEASLYRTSDRCGAALQTIEGALGAVIPQFRRCVLIPTCYFRCYPPPIGVCIWHCGPPYRVVCFG
jgi:hypothetical protein